MGDDLTAVSDWLDLGASTPPPGAQPSFNSPATQDSFSVLDTVATGVDSVSSSAQSIYGSITSLIGTSNAQTQAAQLSAQQRATSQRVQLAQSAAQQHSAQVNANIASALDKITASPILVAVLLLGVAYMIFFRKRG
jgi:Fe2+ transport system protein B